jgi:hypothetical protein
MADQNILNFSYIPIVAVTMQNDWEYKIENENKYVVQSSSCTEALTAKITIKI